jgi:hypothetical protein
MAMSALIFAVIDNQNKFPDREGAVKSVSNWSKLLAFLISTTYLGVPFQFSFDVDISFVSFSFV